VDKPLKSVTHGQCDNRPTVTFPAAGHHCPLTGTKLYCLVTEAHVCEQLAQSCYLTVEQQVTNSDRLCREPTSQPLHPPSHTMAFDCTFKIPSRIVSYNWRVQQQGSWRMHTDVYACTLHRHRRTQNCLCLSTNRPSYDPLDIILCPQTGAAPAKLI